MPKLTPDQKEHLKIARHAAMRIEETWQLFCMYLSQDKTPDDALERARLAVSVWADWMDENQVEPPDIDRPDFTEEITNAMGKVMEHMKANPSGGMGGLVIDRKTGQAAFQPILGSEVDAEFMPDQSSAAHPEASTGSQHDPNPQENT